MNNVHVFTEGIALPYKKISASKLSSLARRAALAEGLENVSITIIATCDSYIREINRAYRKKDSATDVISFANREGGFPAIDSSFEDLGDIYLSLEKAEEQAREYGVSLDREVARLIVHGLLHLAGYDHEKSRAGAREMERREQEILDSL